MKREAFKAVGNPLLMGGPVLFVRDLEGGGAGPLAFEVVSTEITGIATFRVSGGLAPYRFETSGADEVVPAAGEFTHDYGGPRPGGVSASITDAAGATVTVGVLFYVPVPDVWLPVSVSLLELGPVVNDVVEADVFEFFNISAPGSQLLRVRAPFGVYWLSDETGVLLAGGQGPSFGVDLTFGTTQKLILNRADTGVSYGFEVTSPSMLPGEMQPVSALNIVASGNDRSIRSAPTQGSHPNWPNLTVLNTVYGALGQTDHWDEGVGLSVSGDPFGPTSVNAHWNGTAWAAGRAPAAPSLDDQVQAILAGTGGYALDPKDISTLFQDDLGATPVTAPGQTVARIVGKWGSPAVWNTNVVSRRLVWDGASLIFDGVDDFLDGNEEADPSQAAPAMFFCGKLNATDVAATRGILGISVPTATQSRFVVLVDTTNRVQIPSRRPDGSGINVVFNTPLFPVGTDVVLSCLMDAAGASEAYAQINGVRSAPFDLNAPAPFSDTASTRRRLGSHVTNTPLVFSGKMGRVIVCPFVPTEAEWTTFEAWATA